jgi:hypothetical protein
MSKTKIIITILALTTLLTFGLLPTFGQQLTGQVDESISSSFGTTTYKQLTNQQLIDVGCKSITSKLVHNTEEEKLYTIADFKVDLDNYFTFITQKRTEMNEAVKQTDQDLINQPDIILSKDLSWYLNQLYDRFAVISYPTELKIEELSLWTAKEGDVSKNISNNGLKTFLNNQNSSLKYMINYFATKREVINNNTIKSEYQKSEVLKMLEEFKTALNEQSTNMYDRTQKAQSIIDSGYSKIKSTNIVNGNCQFIIQDLDKDTTLEVPIVKQWICEQLYEKDAIHVQYNSDQCIVFK